MRMQEAMTRRVEQMPAPSSHAAGSGGRMEELTLRLILNLALFLQHTAAKGSSAVSSPSLMWLGMLRLLWPSPPGPASFVGPEPRN